MAVGYTYNYGKVLDLVSDARKNVVLLYAVLVAISAKPDHDEALGLGKDGLVDVPRGGKVRQEDGAHSGCGRVEGVRWFRVGGR
jgi:hypothetical protein